MKEARLEARCVALVKARGGLALKLWPTVSGLPDRLVLLPGGHASFVEFKTSVGLLRPRQRVMHAVLAKLGFHVNVVRSYDVFCLLLSSLLSNPPPRS